MISVTELLACYERIAALTGHMLDAARKGDWDGMIALESQYRGQVDEIKRFDDMLPMNDTDRAHKYALIRRILADDAAIRDLTIPRLAQLDSLLRNGRRQLALHETYGLKPGV